MYPDNNQQKTAPDNYLDQIAPKNAKKTKLLNSKLVLISLVGIFFIVAGIIIANIISSAISPDEQLAARLLSTQSILNDATSKIKSTKLSTQNSNLGIYLSNTIRDITPLLKKDNININSLSKKVTAAESNTKTLATLEDARLNAIYDRIYAREMSYKLDTILTLMQQIYDKSNSKTYKTFLQEARTNLKPIQAQFADFNEANS